MFMPSGVRRKDSTALVQVKHRVQIPVPLSEADAAEHRSMQVRPHLCAERASSTCLVVAFRC